MDIDAKLRPLYLIQILKERTDEDHYLTTPQLCAILKEEYGMETHRITIKTDIEMLQQAGVGIASYRSTQNQYNFVDREFDVAELKLLIDAVKSSKFITKSKSEQLVSKLTAFAGSFKEKELKRNLEVEGSCKPENEQIFYIVDAINSAINKHLKIAFRKIEYNVKKEVVLHNDGEVYVFSPYSLVWDGDFYYVVGYSDKYGSIGSHRVDRIAEAPEILDEDAVPKPRDFDINKYVKTTFRMHNAPCAEVELVCDNSLVDAMIDRFGTDVNISEFDKDHFLVTEEVAVGKVFFNWIFGFEGMVKIKSPESVREQYKEKVLKASEQIDCVFSPAEDNIEAPVVDKTEAYDDNTEVGNDNNDTDLLNQ